MSNVIDILTGQPYETAPEIIQSFGDGLMINLAQEAGVQIRRHRTTFYDYTHDAFSDIRDCFSTAERHMKEAMIEMRNAELILRRLHENR